MDDDRAIDLDRSAESALRRLIGRLLNRIEDQQAETAALRDETQRLRGGLARAFRQARRPAAPLTTPRSRSANAPAATADARCPGDPSPRDLDRGQAPPAAQWLCRGDGARRGAAADHVVFRRAQGSSPTPPRTCLAPLPPGYHGQGDRGCGRGCRRWGTAASRRSGRSCAIWGTSCRRGRAPSCWGRTRRHSLPRRGRSGRRGCAAVPGRTSPPRGGHPL